MIGVPPHYLHIYQRPKQGEQFITRKQAFQYRHQKIAVGGDDTMTCEVAVNPVEGELALENWVGCRVAVYVDNPLQPIWEGLITRVYLPMGGLMISRSTDEMFNRVEVQYNNAGTNQLTAAANETDSQAIYGAKHGTAEGFVTNSQAGVAGPMFTAARDLIISQVAWPLTTVTQSDGDMGTMRIEAKGFYHTLKSDTYRNSSGLAVTINAYINAILAALVNGTTFFNNADTSLVSTNTAYSVAPYEQTGKTAWQTLQKVQGGGDGVNYWVMGISPTSPVTGTRRFYYRAARSDVYYTARAQDGLRLRTLYGGMVRPWTAEADRTIRIQDILTGWSGRGIDPRETYIETLRYDADKQSVQWAGADDLHMQGALQIQRYYKIHGTYHGAEIRNTFS